MGAVAGTIRGLVLSGEPFAGATSRHRAEVFVTYPAYTASGDTTTVAAVGAAIAASRRDNKTVTLVGVCDGQSGLQGGVEFYNDTLTVSTDAINGELSDIAGTEINAASGVTQRACSFVVSYDLS
jgi:hypothetical protein